MDIARPEFKHQKRRKQIIVVAGVAVLVTTLTAAVYRLKPAAPSVERGTVLMDVVKRGSILRQVHGTGSLVPAQESVLQIPAETEATVLRIRKCNRRQWMHSFSGRRPRPSIRASV